MKIRLYTKKDKVQVLPLLEEFLEYTKKKYGKVILEFDGYKDSKKKVLASDYLKHFSKLKMLVAEENSEVLGFIVGTIRKTPHKVKVKEGHIESFFISAKTRGQGAGKQLYNSLISWFKKQKCDNLSLDVALGNKSAVSIYKKWGFKPVRYSMKKRI
jgi:ribosomal protein S18 acetylase RimI-like enzyme